MSKVFPYGKIRKALAKSGKPVAKNVKKYVKKAVAGAPDRKYWDLVTSYSPAVGAGSVSIPGALGLVEGTGDNNRIGDSIRPTKFHLRLRTRLTALGANDVTNVGAQRRVRTIVCIDRICDGNNVTNQDLLEANSDVFSYLNQVHQLNKPKRFDILYDHVSNLIRGTDQADFMIDKTFDLKDKAKMKFIGNGTTTADLGQHNIFVFQMTDSATTADIATEYYSRLVFSDA